MQLSKNILVRRLFVLLLLFSTLNSYSQEHFDFPNVACVAHKTSFQNKDLSLVLSLIKQPTPQTITDYYSSPYILTFYTINSKTLYPENVIDLNNFKPLILNPKNQNICIFNNNLNQFSFSWFDPKLNNPEANCYFNPNQQPIFLIKLYPDYLALKSLLRTKDTLQILKDLLEKSQIRVVNRVPFQMHLELNLNLPEFSQLKDHLSLDTKETQLKLNGYCIEH